MGCLTSNQFAVARIFDIYVYIYTNIKQYRIGIGTRKIFVVYIYILVMHVWFIYYYPFKLCEPRLANSSSNYRPSWGWHACSWRDHCWEDLRGACGPSPGQSSFENLLCPFPKPWWPVKLKFRTCAWPMCTHWMIIISMRTWELLVPRSAQNWAVRKRKRQRVRSPWKPKPRWTVVVRLEKTVAYFMRASFPKENDVDFFLGGWVYPFTIHPTGSPEAHGRLDRGGWWPLQASYLSEAIPGGCSGQSNNRTPPAEQEAGNQKSRTDPFQYIHTHGDQLY